MDTGNPRSSSARLSFAALLPLVAVLTFSLLMASLLHAAPGDLDPDFGGSGYAITSVDYDDRANAVAVQPDSAVVVAGSSHGLITTGDNFLTVRYNRDGSLDSGFGAAGTGIIIEDLNIPLMSDWASDVLLQDDGKIVVVGDAGGIGASQPAVVRYDAAGNLDSSFGVDGKAIISLPLALFSSTNSAALQSDGKIVVAGSGVWPSGGTNIFLFRLTPTGQQDLLFGAIGLVNIDINNEGNADTALAVAMDHDDRILVGGYTVSGNVQQYVMLRLTANGALDPAFGSNGVVKTDGIPGASNQIKDIAVDNSGRIVVAGAGSISGADADMTVMRYLENGALDATFGAGGIVKLDFGQNGMEHAAAVALQADGQIVVAGSVQTAIQQPHQPALARFNLDGTVDTSFGDNGHVVTPIANSAPISDMAIGPYGLITAAGSQMDDIVGISNLLVLRYDTRITGTLTLEAWNGVLQAVGDTGVQVALSDADRASCTFEATKWIAFPGGAPDPGEMPTFWSLDTDCSAFVADIRFCYSDQELDHANDVTEQNLGAYRYDGANWNLVDSSVDAPANCVTAYNVSALSDWTIAGAAPTAVALSRLSAQATAQAPPALLAALGLLLATAIIIRLREK